MQRPWVEHDQAERDREDEPEEAAQYYVSKRAPDGGEIPVERYFTALERLRRMPLYSSRLGRFASELKAAGRNEISLGEWTQLGPGNIGGRTRALVINPVNPDIMYAGGVAGGIWKTTDGGASWNALNDVLPSLTISVLAMDPKNAEVLYAGTGEQVGSPGFRGAGIFKTTDSGNTWTRLEATNSSRFYFVNDIVISPNDSQHVYASTYGGLWRSLNGGAAWTIVLDRTSPNSGCQDLVIRTDQPTDYLFAACGLSANSTAVFRNTDAGGAGRWISVLTDNNMGQTSLAIAPSNQSVIYAMPASTATGDYNGGLLAVFRSTSNGDPDTWEARVRNTDAVKLNTLLLTNPRDASRDECSSGKSSFSNQGRYDNVIAVDPMDPNRVWAGGIDLFRSDDGGANWGLASYWWNEASPHFAHADQHALLFHPRYDGDTNQTLFVASDGGLFRTDNARADTAKGAKAACNAGNSAVNWKSLNNNYGVTQFYHGLVYPGGLAYLGGTQDNGTLRGSDAAGTGGWSGIVGGDGGYVAIDPTNVNTVYAETTRLDLRKSTNGGFAFAPATKGITEASTDFPFIARFVMDPNEPKRLWIGGKKLWRTDDAAANWTQAGPNVAEGTVSAIAIAPGNSNQVLVGTSFGHIHRTSIGVTAEAGSEWPSVQPRKGFVSAIAFDPGNPATVYATYSTFNSESGDRHVYASPDGGVSWTGIDGAGNTGLPDAPVNVILVDSSNPATLYVGTDLGIFVSLDRGASWSKETTGFPNTVVEALAVDRGGGSASLFAFTHGRGVWRVRLGGVAPCSYSLAAQSAALDATGGSISLTVTSSDDCSWSAISGASWMTIAAPASGAGTATLQLSAARNSSASPRKTSVAIADQTFSVTQAGIQ